MLKIFDLSKIPQIMQGSGVIRDLRSPTKRSEAGGLRVKLHVVGEFDGRDSTLAARWGVRAEGLTTCSFSAVWQKIPCAEIFYVVGEKAHAIRPFALWHVLFRLLAENFRYRNFLPNRGKKLHVVRP